MSDWADQTRDDAEPCVVTVCICTYRRDSLKDTLESLAAQELDDGYGLTVVVSDNDVTDARRTVITRWARDLGLPLKYVHSPAQNISIARNGALDAVSTRWLAFIDDDEIAAPGWLNALLARRSRANAVIGISQALYEDDSPSWLRTCDFHSNRITSSNDNAYTSNALLDISFVRQANLRFRTELGRTGGEDTLFFREFALKGGQIEYAPDAIVFEPVPRSRANMRWVFRRSFRAGQTHGLKLAEFDNDSFRWLAVSAGAKMMISAAMAVANLFSPSGKRRWAARAALHAGAVSYRCKATMFAEYGDRKETGQTAGLPRSTSYQDGTRDTSI